MSHQERSAHHLFSHYVSPIFLHPISFRNHHPIYGCYFAFCLARSVNQPTSPPLYHHHHYCYCYSYIFFVVVYVYRRDRRRKIVKRRKKKTFSTVRKLAYFVAFIVLPVCHLGKIIYVPIDPESVEHSHFSWIYYMLCSISLSFSVMRHTLMEERKIW